MLFHESNRLTKVSVSTASRYRIWLMLHDSFGKSSAIVMRDFHVYRLLNHFVTLTTIGKSYNCIDVNYWLLSY